MSQRLESANKSVGDSFEHCVVAKLRRLKIEESLCLKNINKISLKENVECIDLPILYSSNIKIYSTRIRNDFSEINNMFEDIKAQTEDNLSSVDIENMKKDVIKLDEKLRTFKNYLQSELVSLVAQEEDLNKAVNETEVLKQTTSFKLFKPKKSIKPFNNIVPSPVKALIKSPFKCKEVQQFQDFMKNSPNRYGGWNEYHHNIFVQVWQKHFNTDVENIFAKDAFETELLQKISGATREDISRHQEWYSKYLSLKTQQQNALNKWRNGKRRLGNTRYTYQGDQNKSFNQPQSLNTVIANDTGKPILESIQSIDTTGVSEIASVLHGMELSSNDSVVNDGQMETNNKTMGANESSSKAIKYIRRKSTLRDVMKPTKQWSNRCNSLPHTMNGICNIEHVTKLRTPNWRLALLN